MGTTESKFKPTTFSCYEVCHTWSPYCTVSAVDVGIACVLQSLRIYSTIYLGGAVIKGRIPTKQEIYKLFMSILRSTWFLSYNAFGFVAAHCTVRKILGYFNFLTLSFVPGWLSSFAAILVEKPSRRIMLATYVTNIASESLYNSLVLNKIIPKMKYLDFVLFAVSLPGYFYLCQNSTMKDPTLHLSRLILNGKKPTNKPNEDTSKNELAIILKDTIKHFVFGVFGQSALNMLKSFRSGKRIIQQGFMARYSFAMFAASVTFTSRMTKYILKKTTGDEKQWHSALAGLISSPSYFLFRSRDAAFYLFWKLAEIYVRKLNGEGLLPTIPLFTEILYATSTGMLFYFGMLEPHSLKKSYLDFLNKITGDKILAVNHGLIDELYGSKTGLVYNYKPTYQSQFISDELRSHIPKVGNVV